MNSKKKEKILSLIKQAKLTKSEVKEILVYYEKKDKANVKVDQTVIPERDAGDDCYRLHRRRIIPIRCPACGSTREFVCDDVVKRKAVISGYGHHVQNIFSDSLGRVKISQGVVCCECGHKFIPENGPAVWDIDDKVITNRDKIKEYLKEKNKRWGE